MIGISLLTLVPGISGGSETYARELVRALGRVGELEYRVLLPTIAPDVDGLPHEIVGEYRASRSLAGRIAAMSFAAAAPWRLRRRFRGLDALHFPLSVMLPPVSSPPAVSSLLDVQHEFLPQFFPRAEVAYRRAVYGWTVRRSRLVITISEHAAGAIAARLGVPASKLRPIHLGIDHERFPHKNHERLFEAFALLRAERPGLRLVLTGGGHSGAVPDGVETRGQVCADELVSLYRRASVLVFPSLYEGFGQPPLEAMACGCPVACSDAASLPEIVGDAARLFDPLSPESIAAAVRDVLAAPDEWSAKGLARASGFSWEACARGHDAVYRELL